MHMINVAPQFERDFLVERTQSGFQRAKAEGKSLGRLHRLSAQEKQEALQDRQSGLSVFASARTHLTSCQAIMRLKSSNEFEEEK